MTSSLLGPLKPPPSAIKAYIQGGQWVVGGPEHMAPLPFVILKIMRNVGNTNTERGWIYILVAIKYFLVPEISFSKGHMRGIS